MVNWNTNLIGQCYNNYLSLVVFNDTMNRFGDKKARIHSKCWLRSLDYYQRLWGGEDFQQMKTNWLSIYNAAFFLLTYISSKLLFFLVRSVGLIEVRGIYFIFDLLPLTTTKIILLFRHFLIFSTISLLSLWTSILVDFYCWLCYATKTKNITNKHNIGQNVRLYWFCVFVHFPDERKRKNTHNFQLR